MTCAVSVSRCWEFVCFEECEERGAGGYLTQLRLEHLFQLLFLGWKWPVLTLFFPSLQSSCSSPCLSNAILASWEEICHREEEAPGPAGHHWWGSGTWQSGCSCAGAVCAYLLPTSALNAGMFPVPPGPGSLLCPGVLGRRCLIQHTQGFPQIQPHPSDSFSQGCSSQQIRWEQLL